MPDGQHRNKTHKTLHQGKGKVNKRHLGSFESIGEAQRPFFLYRTEAARTRTEKTRSRSRIRRHLITLSSTPIPSPRKWPGDAMERPTAKFVLSSLPGVQQSPAGAAFCFEVSQRRIVPGYRPGDALLDSLERISRAQTPILWSQCTSSPTAFMR